MGYGAVEDVNAGKKSTAPASFFLDRDLSLLHALEQVFPNVPSLLCLWHIIKDEESHARKGSFPRETDPLQSRPRAPQYRDYAAHRNFCDAFVRVVNATSENEYELRRRELHLLSPREAAYVDDVWLELWRWKIVRCWTDQVLHFGVRATSRAEGYHATLKSWLGYSNGDFLSIPEKLTHWWSLSVLSYRAAKANDGVQVPARLEGWLFANVVRRVHRHALLQCDEARRNTELLVRPCTGAFSRSTGLPCAHTLHRATLLGQPLTLEEFNAHWWVDRTDEPQPLPLRVLEPLPIRQRQSQRRQERKRRRGCGVNGTRRVPSGFELSLQQHSDTPQLSQQLYPSEEFHCLPDQPSPALLPPIWQLFE